VAADLTRLVAYLSRIPAASVTSTSTPSDARWSVWMQIDVTHRLAWHVVQELAYVLNGLSVTETLPTIFVPMSPPPYMNGGPEEYLSWVIRAQTDDADPDVVAQYLEGRLPRPVDDPARWPS
jgi:hypothetical protein